MTVKELMESLQIFSPSCEALAELTLGNGEVHDLEIEEVLGGECSHSARIVIAVPSIGESA